MSELKPPEEFGANGYQWTLVKADGCVALYRGKNKHSPATGYEVHILLHRAAENIRGKHYLERWTPQGNEDFGEYAWSYQHRDAAEECFVKTVEAIKSGARKQPFHK